MILLYIKIYTNLAWIIMVTASRKIEIDKQVLEPKKLEGKELAQKQNIYSRTVVKVSIAGRIKTKIRNLFYKVNKKRWSVISILFALLFSFNSSAEEAIFNEKDFFIKLSTDNNIISSQNAPTNVAFSAISGLAYLTDKFDLSKNPFYRFGLGYSTIMITILNHELSGHGFRALEFGSKITKLEINPIKFSGALSFSISPFNSHRQKQTMISLGGMQASYLLSQKIADHLVFRNQKIDFITGIGYFFSAFDQINYNYMNNDVASDKGWRSKESCIEKIRNYSNGHDVQSYSIFMQEMYGDGSITMNTMKFHGLLSLLDPILFASIYSFTLHKSVDVPMLNIGKIGIIPFARSVFAPYGTIEKKFGSYILTDYTPIKVGFSVGKQFKTATPRLNNLDRSCLYSHLDTFCSDYSLSCDSESSIGIFTGLEKDEIVEQHMTYSFDISVFKLLNFDKLNIGANAVFWRQPELFVKDPYRAKPKNGFMLMLNASYKTSDKLNVLFDVGYKTKGFIPGQYLGETSIINLALEYKM